MVKNRKPLVSESPAAMRWVKARRTSLTRAAALGSVGGTLSRPTATTLAWTALALSPLSALATAGTAALATAGTAALATTWWRPLR